MQMKVVGQMEDIRGQESDRGSLSYIKLTTGPHTNWNGEIESKSTINICSHIEDCNEPKIDHKVVIRGQEGPHGSLQLLKRVRYLETDRWLNSFTFSTLSFLTSVLFCIGRADVAAPIYNCALVIHQNTIQRSPGSLPVQQHGPSQAMTWPLKCQGIPPPWEQYTILMTSRVKVSGRDEQWKIWVEMKSWLCINYSPNAAAANAGVLLHNNQLHWNAKGAFFSLLLQLPINTGWTQS